MLNSLYLFRLGMEIYSTTLWHLQNEVALSALAQDLVETERVCAEVGLNVLIFLWKEGKERAMGWVETQTKRLTQRVTDR